MIIPNSALLALAASLLPSTALAWNAAFYDQRQCNDASSTFDYAIYSGSGRSSCQVIGEPGNNCNYYTDDGNGRGDCTKQFTHPAQSVSIQSGTRCYGYLNADCTGGTTNDLGPKCADWSNVGGENIAFICEDA